MKQKPKLSFWQIWNMSFGFLGIQFGFALQNANVSRIFETLGANIEDIPILWVAAPVTGLIMQPIIGHMSDKTWGKLGRRRPYFLVGAILASLALLILPNSPVLWMAAGMLWILDASINISMEPFRAFVGDMLPSEQRTNGFAMQSFFIGTGAVVASALPYMLTNWFGVQNIAQAGNIPPSVKWSFYLGALAFISAILWTIFKTKEYSPEELKSFEKPVDVLQKPEITNEINERKFNSIGFISFFIGASTTLLFAYLNFAKELFIFSIGLMAFGIIELLAGFMHKLKKTNGFLEVITDLNSMPKTMIQLAFVQFFSWFALFAMWIYTTAGVTSHIYDMKVNQLEYNSFNQAYIALKSNPGKEKSTLEVLPDMESLNKKIVREGESAMSMKLVKFFTSNLASLEKASADKITYVEKQYNDGADWVGVCFSVYNGAAAIFAFLLMFLAKLTNRKITHSISLVIGGISFISIFFISNPLFLVVPFIGIGLAWASILAMPYAILTGSLPVHKMGTYMGIFNFFIVIPQILAASLLGFFVKQIFDGEAIYALFLGGGSLLIASMLVIFVNDKD
jgi:maltose/moltooligosaccharide transporter